MTTTVTFNSLPLSRPSPLKPKVITGLSFEITIDCMTDDYTEIENLQAYAGVVNKFTLLSGEVIIQTTSGLYDLVITADEGLSDTFSNCAIVGGIQANEVPGTGGKWWKYRVTFAQDTGS